MECPSALLDCQLLVYILSLLDDVKDVNSCQLSCRQLLQLINENRHQMAKHKGTLEITSYGAPEDATKGPLYILKVNDVNSKFSERHAEATPLENRFTIEYYQTGTVQLYFKKSREDEKESGAVKESAPNMEWETSDIQENLKQHIVQCFTQFDIRYISVDTMDFPEELYSFLVENVRRFELKMQSCSISSMSLKELPLLMGCSYVLMRLAGDDDNDYHELMLNFPFDKMAVHAIQFGQNPCLGALIFLLNEWCNGEREIHRLTLVFAVSFPSDDVMSRLLEQYNVIHTNNVVVGGEKQIEAFITRDCDSKTLRFAHSSNVMRRIMEIWPLS